MTRYLLKIEYDGRPFCGWQRQDNGLSVQQAIEEAIFSFCQEKVLVMASGRTDAGGQRAAARLRAFLHRDRGDPRADADAGAAGAG